MSVKSKVTTPSGSVPTTPQGYHRACAAAMVPLDRLHCAAATLRKRQVVWQVARGP